MACFHSYKGATAAAFTLRELVVVVAVLCLLSMTLIASLHRAASWHIKKAQCAANLRQFAQATQLYAAENRDRLPEITAGTWAWDLPTQVAGSLLQYGMEQRTFYCPGTAPRFDDKANFQNPYPNSLWTFAEPVGFRVLGYIAAFTGPAANPTAFSLVLSNQNTTILAEPPRINSFTIAPIPPNSERVLLADATISENTGGTPALPNAAGSFTSVAGGFSVNGIPMPHLSPHLKGILPAGGNLVFKDGHVDWRKFAEMRQRATSQRGFWW
jgi:type II secretory pathway pseudopilin PulG